MPSSLTSEWFSEASVTPFMASGALLRHQPMGARLSDG